MSWGTSTRTPLDLRGRRVQLRSLTVADFEAWQEVRRRCRDWLVKWEPKPLPGQPDAAEDRRVFAARCGARDRERQLGSGYGFGIFVGGRFGGEINLSSIQRGPFQNAGSRFPALGAELGNQDEGHQPFPVSRFRGGGYPEMRATQPCGARIAGPSGKNSPARGAAWSLLTRPARNPYKPADGRAPGIVRRRLAPSRVTP